MNGHQINYAFFVCLENLISAFGFVNLSMLASLRICNKHENLMTFDYTRTHTHNMKTTENRYAQEIFQHFSVYVALIIQLKHFSLSFLDRTKGRVNHL